MIRSYGHNNNLMVNLIFFTMNWTRLFKRKIFSISTLLKIKKETEKKKQQQKSEDNSFLHSRELTGHSYFELLVIKQSVGESLSQLTSKSAFQ